MKKLNLSKNKVFLAWSCVNGLFLIVSVLYLFTGSQEMFPTMEQEEKTTISMILLIVLLSFIQIWIICQLRKYKQKKWSE